MRLSVLQDTVKHVWGEGMAMHLYMTCSAPERSTWHMIAADLAVLPSFAPFANRGMKACEEYKLPRYQTCPVSQAGVKLLHLPWKQE